MGCLAPISLCIEYGANCEGKFMQGLLVKLVDHINYFTATGAFRRFHGVGWLNKASPYFQTDVSSVFLEGHLV